MVKTYQSQTALNGGEISPRLHARPDLQRYQNGLARCANFIPTVQGGVIRRPGTRFVAEVKDSAGSQRLIPFVFSRTQSYVLEFGDEYVRFYMLGGQLYDSAPNYTLLDEADATLLDEAGEAILAPEIDPTAAPFELVSPYSESEISSLQFAQTADVMFITHPNHPVRTLTRTGHTSWSFAEFDHKNGPFMGYNVEDGHTLQSSAVSGTVTITSSEDLFDDGHVGAFFYIEEEDSDDYSMWEADRDFSLGEKARWDTNVYEVVVDNGNSGNVAPVHLEGARWDGRINGSIKWEYLHSGFGIVRITAVASATSATATVIKRLPENVVSGATKNWKEGAWSDYRGYPRAVTLYEQRAWFASTDYRPQSLWASVAGDLFDFDDTDLPDNAIVYTLNTRQANPIQALSDGLVLNIFAQDREMIGKASANSAGVAQDDFAVKPSTSAGSSAVLPETVDTSTIFVDASGFRLIELAYSLEYDGFAPNDLTILAEHITKPGQ